MQKKRKILRKKKIFFQESLLDLISELILKVVNQWEHKEEPWCRKQCWERHCVYLVHAGIGKKQCGVIQGDGG